MDNLLLPNGYWYLASPYSKYPGGRRAAFNAVAQLAGALINRGIYVLSPITYSHPISENGDIDHDDFETWLGLDEQFMLGAHGMLIAKFRGWETSSGIEWEHNWMLERNKPVHFIDPSDYGVAP